MPIPSSTPVSVPRRLTAALVAAGAVCLACLVSGVIPGLSQPASAATADDLLVIKAADTGAGGAGVVYNGDTITYTIIITNPSASLAATDVLVVDALPSDTLDNLRCAEDCQQVVETTVVPEPTGGTVVISVTRQLSWTITTLAPGASARRSFSARVTGQADGTVFTNRVFASYHQGGAVKSTSSNELPTTARVHIAQTGEASLSPVPTWFSRDLGGTISQDWGDFDRDGDLDLALASSVGLSIYRNDSGRLNRLWGNDRQTYGVAWGDFLGDGSLAVVAVGDSVDDSPVSEGINYIYRHQGAEFVQAGVFTSEQQLVRVVPGDFRGLGVVDLVASTNFINASCPVRLYRNDGAGNFTTTADDCISTSATAALAAADVDNNGSLDLALGVFPHHLQVRINDGSGHFSTTLAVDGYLPFLPFDLKFGDLDADGFLDLAAAFPLQREARVYRNLQGAGFQAPIIIPTSLFWTPLTVDWADFHGTGRLDLVVADSPPAIYQYSGGAFTLASRLAADSVTGRIWSLRGVRVLPDGDLNLAVSNRDGPSLLFDGLSPHLSTNITPVDPTPASSIAWGDADGDGSLDLAMGAGSPPAVGARIYYNTRGALTITNKLSLVPAGLGPQSLAFADVDNNGRLDLAIGATGETELYMANQTAPAWTSALPAAANHIVAWGDADNNGTLDLLTAGQGGPVALYLNRSGVLSPLPDYQTPITGNVTSLAWCDLDRDGFPDFIAGRDGQSTIAYHNDRRGGFAAIWDSGYTSATTSIACADYNGDSYPDLAIGNYQQNIVLFENIAGALGAKPAWVSPVSRNTTSLAWGDWNNDGYPELAVGNRGEPAQVYANLASSPATPRLFWAWTSAEVQQTTGVAWGDLNGDGYLDLALSQDGGGTSGVYANTTIIGSRYSDIYTPTMLLPNNPAYVWLPRPGNTDDGYFNSSAEILSGPSGPTVTVHYFVFDPDGSRVASGSNVTGTGIAATVFEYSLDGGSTWHRASRDVTSPQPITNTTRLGLEGIFVWDAVADQAISDDARFRVRVISADRYGPVQRAASTAVSPPFRVRATTCIWPEDPLIYTYPLNPPPNTTAYLIATLRAGSGALVFAWDFGDGSAIEYGQTVQHIFTQTADYTVTLTVMGEACPSNRERVFTTTISVGTKTPVYQVNLPLVANSATFTSTANSLTTSPTAPGAASRVLPGAPGSTPASIGAPSAGAPRFSPVASPAAITAPGAPCSLTLVSGLTVGVSDQAAGNATGQRVAFWSTADFTGNNRDGSIEVFLAEMGAGGSVTYTQVTSSTGSVLGGFNFAPSIDDLGRRIAFYSERDLTGGNADGNFEIFLAELNGGSTVTISQITTSTIGASILPSISGDGRLVAFATDRNMTTKNPDGNTEIVLAEIDATHGITYTVVTRTTGGSNTQPSLSRDGARVAFLSDRDLTGANSSLALQVIVAALDVSGQPAFYQVTTGAGGWIGRPTVSSNGRQVAFASDRDLTGGNPARTPQIFLANVDNSGVVTLTQVTNPSLGAFDQPVLSSDGTRVAFVSLTAGSVYLFDAVTDAFFQISADGSESLNPTVDRDGVRLSFTAGRGVYAALCPMVDLAVSKGSQPTSVLAGEGIAYTIVITNSGPSPATNVVLADSLAPELQEVVPPDQVDDDNTATGFGGGTFRSTRWSGATFALELDMPAQAPASQLPDARANTWVNMAGNALLLHLNEVAGARVFTDTSGLGNAGACSTTACPVAGAPGKLGAAVTFDGINDAVTVPYTNGLNFEGRITMLGWVNALATDGTRNILAHGPGGPGVREVYLRIKDGNYEAGTLYTGVNHQARTPVTAGSGTWVHVAGVYDGESYRLYVNGTLRAVQPDIVGPVTVLGNWGIGATGDGALRFFSGSLDELAVFSRALSADEIQDVYNRQAPLFAGFGGSFDSRVMDARAPLPWQTLSWMPSLPAGKPLPNYGQVESGYSGGMANMAGNTLLLHLSEVAGAITFTDTSGSGHPGACIGTACPTAGVAGRFGSALRFDGVNDMVTVLDPPDPSAYTVEMWVRPAAATSAGLIARTDSSGTGLQWSHQLRINSAGKFEHYTFDGIGRSVAGTSGVVPGLWYHVAAVATSNGPMRLYVNGHEEGTATSIGNLWTGGDRWVIGAGWGGAGQPLNGFADEVAVFNRVLSAQEIYDHYRRGAESARFQVRSCATISCTQASEIFVGPDGTSATYYSEISNTTTTPPTITVTLPDRRYFQYRAFLDTDSLAINPAVSRVAAGPSHESVTASQGACSGIRDIQCALGQLQAGQTATVTIVSQVSGLARGRVLNSANVVAAETERNRANNTASIATPILADTDLAVTQTTTFTSAVAGMPFTYTVWAHNNGPKPATGVQVYDRMPDGAVLNYIPGECQYDGTLIVCTLSDMQPADTHQVIVVAQIGPDARGIVTNTASIGSNETDPDTGNNTSVQTSPVAAFADLTTLVSAADTVIAGTPITYTLNVANWGPSSATGIVITNALPLSATQIITSSHPYSLTGNVITWTVGGLSPTIGISLTVEVTVSGSARAALTDTAGVRAIETDPNLANNTSSRETLVSAQADLVLAKVAAPSQVTVGTQLTYTLWVTNSGPSDAFDVVLTDTLPPSLTVSTIQPVAVCTDGGEVLTCTLGTVPAATTAQIVVETSVARKAFAGVITNTSGVTTTTFDPDPSTNAASASASVRTMADLEVTKIAPASVMAGTGIVYTMTVINHGPSDATLVVFTDTLPAITVSSVTPGCAAAGGVVTCSLGTIGDVLLQNTRQITVAATVPASTTQGSILTNSATAAGREDDDVAANNVASPSTIVHRLADLSLALAASSEPVLAGNYLTYTLTLTNTGPSDASSVTLTNTLPGAVTYASASDGCSHAAGVVTCLLPTMPAGATRVLTVAALVPSITAEGALLNDQATVAAAETDPVPADNSAAVTTTVHARADLAITKWTQSPPILAGGLVTYTLAITNYGPSDALSVLVTDSLPAGVSVVATPTAWLRSGASLIGDLGAVFGGESRQFTIAVSVPTSTPRGTLLLNSVQIASPTEDLGPALNSFAVTSTVETSADLALSKFASPDPVFLASPLTYTLVITNLGPSDAMNVVLTDTLPAGVSLASATTTSGACSYTGASITCTLGNSVSGPNLVANPGAESGSLAGWTILANGGAGWSVTSAAAHDGALSFATSTAWDTRYQEIDLLAAGLPAAYLDLAPAVNLEEWFAGAGNLPDSYYLKAELRRADHSAIASWNAGSLVTPLPVGAAWEQAGTTFVGYGAGARYLYLEDGGVASGFLPDPLGARMDSALAQVASRATPPGVYTVTLLVNVTATTGGQLTNTALISSGTADPSAANNQAQAAPMAQTNADLSIAKTASSGSLAAGELITYTLTVVNPLAATLTNVVVTDSLPSSVITISLPSGCTGSGTLTCALGDLGPSSTTVLTIAARVDPAAAAGVITNTAGVTSTTNADLVAGNNFAAAETTISRSADLYVTQDYAPAVAMQRQSVFYTVTVTNTGPSLATGVILTDQLPVDVASWSASATQGACGSGSTFECTIGSLDPGAAARVYVTATVSTGARVLTNTTWAAGLETDPDTSNNVFTTTITVKQADLAIAKVASSEPAYAGAPLTYTLTITNNGPDGATGVVVTDTLPPTVTLSSATPGCALAGSVITCTVGSLPQTPGANTTVITVAVTVSGTAAHNSLITNSAMVAGLETDPDPANDTSSVTSTVQRRANLSLSKSASSDPAVAGSTLTYTLLLVNNGPDTANGLTVTDTLPASVTFRAASPICAQSSGTVTCTFSNLSGQAGANTRSISITVDLPVTLTQGATLTNTAIAAATEIDLDPADNTATRTVSVARQADMALAKWAQTSTATAGDTITFSIAITNLGRSQAGGVTITDTLPVSSTFVGATGSHVEAGSLVTWTIADLLPNESASVTVWATVDAAAATGPVTNTARVFSNEADFVPANNSDDASVAVRGYADLVVIKVAIPDPPTQKQSMTYVVTVTNQGPAPATSVRLTDTLPSTLSGPNDTVSQGTCTGTSTVSCQLGSLAAGASATLRVTGTVQNHTTTMQNVARTTAYELDATPADNVYTLTTTTLQADLRVTKGASAEPAIAGATLTYTIRITNTGPDKATGVTITDTLPPDAVYQSASSACSHSGSTVVCAVGALDSSGASSSAVLTIAVSIPSTIPHGTTWSNSVAVDANETDPDLSNNSFTLDSTINRQADLTVVKTASSPSVVTGGAITYTITVTNTGPSEATSVALSDTLPVSTTFAAASSGYTRNGSVLYWTLGTLAPQAAISVTCAVTVANAATGSVVNTARVWANETDPTSPSVATASATVTSAAPVSLAVTGPTTGTLGTVSVFTATVNVTATLPITYTWTISPTLDVTHTTSYALTDTISLTWVSTGTLVITATATNATGAISGTLPTDQGLTYLAQAALPPGKGVRVYLPIVVRLNTEP